MCWDLYRMVRDTGLDTLGICLRDRRCIEWCRARSSTREFERVVYYYGYYYYYWGMLVPLWQLERQMFICMHCYCIDHTIGFGSNCVLCSYGSCDHDSCSSLCNFDGHDAGSGGSTRLLHRSGKTIRRLGRITVGRIIDNATASMTMK
mmetsp:Transcript_18172/g.52001  ORF Transcript_18172/g.52001 Transcript_18172/m.52001 type:complete len:148 (-) Transcript_18172:4438-4881(-)